MHNTDINCFAFQSLPLESFSFIDDFPNDNKEKSFGNLPLADTPLPKGKA